MLRLLSLRVSTRAVPILWLFVLVPLPSLREPTVPCRHIRDAGRVKLASKVQGS